jgi:hypothetical protein
MFKLLLLYNPQAGLPAVGVLCTGLWEYGSQACKKTITRNRANDRNHWH